MASSMAGYNPVSYHAGSVWPHDTALAIAGLRRYGFTDEANRLALGLIDLADTADGRLPELVAGFSRDEFSEPVPYPTSCSPQAWAAAAPLLLVRTFLGFEPDLPAGQLHLDPSLPEAIAHLRVEGIPLAGSRLTIDVAPDGVSVNGAPTSVEIVEGH
jgi:glycogen debranching enzyme